ncbi:uncharacterized protein A4U43_C07F35670 [Asparagus officinalis]|uniref:GDSL esterase/lipase n=1 Tax=Asparagus officinalis TaxID=4686 RepID=A0A5P1EHB6_ASPOF|nr:GDSL esterase/lipase At5g03810-like [Asparagus officinalis]ONK65296.1 uncharacterized protein A4U43_C07F35670 [Asparagus officinalis]
MTLSMVVAQVFLLGLVGVLEGQSLVPAVFFFGDSIFDAGNNNHLPTLVKANFPPYGRDFINHSATGRFCNGKLAIDFIVEILGFDAYPQAYLSKHATGDNLLTGANFASAASGYLDATAALYKSISLTQQLRYYKEYQSKLKIVAQSASANVTNIISGSLYIISAGNSDYLQNYYINPLVSLAFTPDQFADLLVQSCTTFVQDLYRLGARRIGVTSLPPLGCLPAAITIYGFGSNDCVSRLNNDSLNFNKKLEAAGEALKKAHPDLKLVVFDIYNPLLDLIKNPGNNGFFESRRACCGTGTIETSILCNEITPGTCANATGYVFWDSFHPSEAANEVLFESLFLQGISLVF